MTLRSDCPLSTRPDRFRNRNAWDYAEASRPEPAAGSRPRIKPMNTGERVRAERRLAAILAADIVGYSRLIGADEEGTLLRLRSIRAEVIDRKIAEHDGRLVKTTGDGLLVEFGSVVDAL